MSSYLVQPPRTESTADLGTEAELSRARKAEQENLFRQLRPKPGNVDPCFMTGKGCVYTDVIESLRRAREGKDAFAGFIIMPFRKNVGVFFKNCLQPFLYANYECGDAKRNDRKFIAERGDEVRRPGIIICEGICKRIQESDFIIADVSLPNPNVFYELGLAYGIGQKIVAIHHDQAAFGARICEYLREAGCKPYRYHDLDPIRAQDCLLSNHIWQKSGDDGVRFASPGNVILVEQLWKREDLSEAKAAGLTNASGRETARNEDAGSAAVRVAEQDLDVPLEFSAHVLSAVGLAIDEIAKEVTQVPVVRKYRELIGELRTAVPCRGVWPRLEGFRGAGGPQLAGDPTPPPMPFAEMQRRVEKAYCAIVLTGTECHPMAYFWLGYGHARGKNVIPITVITSEKDQVKDLAFDIRAQRHMTFVHDAPDRLAREMTQTLKQMIHADFGEYSRKRFWDRIVGRRGEVSIFTGALRNKDFEREMIGDWDLRAASELTSFFGRHQYRAKIETPVYAIESISAENRSSYVPKLQSMMSRKNCILIASPDVNPLTEIALGEIYDVEEGELFGRAVDTRQNAVAIVALKEKKVVEPGTVAQRALYLERQAGGNRRGFASGRIRSGEIMEEFVNQVEAEAVKQVYAHLAIIRRTEAGREHHVVVLNGVGGPATFALTHVLTGGVNPEFVSYAPDFDPEEESEAILKEILDEMDRRPQFSALECIIRVEVGPESGEDQTDGAGRSNFFDWRRIRRFVLVRDAFPKKEQAFLVM